MPINIVRFVNMSYDTPQATLVVLTTANALLGAVLAALGSYLLTESIREFTSTSPAVCLIIIGLLLIFAADLATTGIITQSWTHIRIVASLGLLAILAELMLMLAVSQSPIRARTSLRNSWLRMYTGNRLALQRVEHMFGCCGFEDSANMPSHSNCSLGGKAQGCYEHLAQAVFYLSKIAAKWVTFAVVVQVLSLILGSYLIVRVFEVDRAWLIEPEMPAAGDVPPSEPLAAAAAPAMATDAPPPSPQDNAAVAGNATNVESA
ncbi:hypothetical protein IWW55_002593 [Coemansia sp. RSA 2706]|nr:hypothetical protein LPJ63_004167 [Coemansia sp. RSA 2711]KAJ2304088.1 hypothetical protein IWW55_002593 [Coemansia sp. RSA 2706]